MGDPEKEGQREPPIFCADGALTSSCAAIGSGLGRDCGTGKGGGTIFGAGTAAARTKGCDRDGGGLATDESRTTTFPAKFFLGGFAEAKGGGPIPAPPAEGDGDLGAPSGTGGLSDIILSAWVYAKYRNFKARQRACCQ